MANLVIMYMTDHEVDVEKIGLVYAHARSIAGPYILLVRLMDTPRLAESYRLKEYGVDIDLCIRSSYSRPFPTEEEIKSHPKWWRENRFFVVRKEIEDYLVAVCMLVSGFDDRPKIDCLYRSYKYAKTRNHCAASMAARVLEIPIVDL